MKYTKKGKRKNIISHKNIVGGAAGTQTKSQTSEPQSESTKLVPLSVFAANTSSTEVNDFTNLAHSNCLVRTEFNLSNDWYYCFKDYSKKSRYS